MILGLQYSSEQELGIYNPYPHCSEDQSSPGDSYSRRTQMSPYRWHHLNRGYWHTQTHLQKSHRLHLISVSYQYTDCKYWKSTCTFHKMQNFVFYYQLYVKKKPKKLYMNIRKLTLHFKDDKYNLTSFTVLPLESR